MSNRAARRRESREMGKKGQRAQIGRKATGESTQFTQVQTSDRRSTSALSAGGPAVPASPGEAVQRLWDLAEQARQRGDVSGYHDTAWAVLHVQPDHKGAKRALKWERAAWESRRDWDELGWVQYQEQWLLSVWHSRNFVSGLPAAHPANIARQREWAELTDCWQRIVRDSPRDIAAAGRLLWFLEQQGRQEEALQVVTAALSRLGPGQTFQQTILLNARAMYLVRLGRHREAMQESRRLLALPIHDCPTSDSPVALSAGPAVSNAWLLLCRCQALERLGRDPEALARAQQAVSADPDNASAREALARGLVRAGHIRAGYQQFMAKATSLSRYLGADAVLWDGSPLAENSRPLPGRRLRVCSWEGLGDAVQYARYVALLVRQGASVLLVCDDGAERLLCSLQQIILDALGNASAEFCGSVRPGDLTVVPWSQHRHDHLVAIRRSSTRNGAKPGPPVGWQKAWDLDMPLDAMPCFFGEEDAGDAVPFPEGVPLSEGYLRPAPEDMDRMRGLLTYHDRETGEDETGGYSFTSASGSQRLERPFRVGLVWRGGTVHDNDGNRSLPLAALAPLAGVPGCVFFALQKGAAAEAEDTPPGMPLRRLSPFLRDLADTAAAMCLLDLVITVDSSPCHLAGALGVPVWTLLPAAADWRWQMGREDTPWYASMRLFRQKEPGDWPEVIQRVASALADAVGAGPSASCP